MKKVESESRVKIHSKQSKKSKGILRREAMSKIVKETKAESIVDKGGKFKKLNVLTKMESDSEFFFNTPFWSKDGHLV